MKIKNYSLSFIHGFNLKSYDFNKYKTQNLENEKGFSKNLHLISSFSNEIEAPGDNSSLGLIIDACPFLDDKANNSI